MANRISGITIEINGDTSKLSSALSGVNKDLRATQTALRDVDKLLKFNPGNTDLLRQKQQLLKTAIEDTKRSSTRRRKRSRSSRLRIRRQKSPRRCRRSSVRSSRTRTS